jgi:hypothetical protein
MIREKISRVVDYVSWMLFCPWGDISRENFLKRRKQRKFVRQLERTLGGIIRERSRQEPDNRVWSEATLHELPPEIVGSHGHTYSTAGEVQFTVFLPEPTPAEVREVDEGGELPLDPGMDIVFRPLVEGGIEVKTTRRLIEGGHIREKLSLARVINMADVAQVLDEGGRSLGSRVEIGGWS